MTERELERRALMLWGALLAKDVRRTWQSAQDATAREEGQIITRALAHAVEHVHRKRAWWETPWIIPATGAATLMLRELLVRVFS